MRKDSNVHFSLNALVITLLFLSIASLGCGHNAGSPQAKPPVGPAVPPVVPTQPEAAEVLTIPTGDVLAHLRKDFRTNQNPHPDGTSSGQWTYIDVRNVNPFVMGKEVGPLRSWNPKAPYYHSDVQVGRGHHARLSVARGDNGRVLLTPPIHGDFYLAVRWTSEVDANVNILGKWLRQTAAEGTGIEAFVYVDGAREWEGMLQSKDGLEMSFEVPAAIAKGTIVDFVLAVDRSGVILEESHYATDLETAIVRTAVATEAPEQIEPQVLAKIRTAWSGRQRSIPKTADIAVSVDQPTTRTNWYHKVLMGDLSVAGKWQATSSEFLGHYSQYLAADPAAPRVVVLQELAATAIAAEDSPLLKAAQLDLALNGTNAAESKRLAATLQEIDAPARQALASPLATTWLDLLDIKAAYQEKDQNRTTKLVGQFLDHLITASQQPGLADLDRQMLVRQVETLLSLVERASDRRLLQKKLQTATQMDPWVRHILLSREHLAAAWRARGNGTIDTVSPASFKRFQDELDRAKTHGVNAWDLHRELPEAAAILIAITMAGGGVAGESSRFWFDEAMQADICCWDAHQRYTWSLRPRWGGSHEAMLGLAQECLATERFDSGVPLLYRAILADIASELGGWQPVFASFGVEEDLNKMLEGYEALAPDEQRRRSFRTQKAAISWIVGRPEEARKRLLELGGEVDRTGFAAYGLTYSKVWRELEETQRDLPAYFPEDTHEGTCLEFLDSGELLSGGRDGKITVWNVSERTLQKVLSEHESAILSIEQWPEPGLLLTADAGGTAIIWDSALLEPKHRLKLQHAIHAATWERANSTVKIAVGDELTTAMISWDFKQDRHTQEPLQQVNRRFNRIAFTSDDQKLFASAFEWPHRRRDWLWFIGSARMVTFGLFPSGVSAWELSPDGKIMLICGDGPLANVSQGTRGHALGLLSIENSGILRTCGSLPAPMRRMRVMPESTDVVMVGDGGSAAIWDSAFKPKGPVHIAPWAVANQPATVVRANVGRFSGFTIAPDASRFAALDGKQQVHVWPLERNRWRIDSPLLTTNLGTSISSMTLVDQGKRLAIYSTTGGVSIWSATNGYSRAEQSIPVSLDANSALPLSPGGRVAVISQDQSGAPLTQILHTEADEGPKAIALGGRTATCLTESFDGKLLAVGDDQGGVTVVSSEDYDAVPWGRLQEHKTGIVSLAVSRDGKTMVTLSKEGAARLWSLPQPGSEEQVKSRSTLHTGRANAKSIAIHPSGKLIAVVGDRTDVYDGQSSEFKYSLPGSVAAFSPDGNTLLTANATGLTNSARLWNANTQEELVSLEGGHAAPITAAAFLEDGRVVLTADNSGDVRAWDAQTGDELLELPIAEKP